MHIERDGASLFYTTVGSGPDVVMLHPTPVHHAFWIPVAELLADKYRITLIDLRGHGQSTLGEGPLTMAKFAEDTHAILAALGIERAAFVGCSIGVYALFEFWRLFPGQVAALVLACGKPQGDSPANHERRKEWMQLARQPGGLKEFFDLMTETLVGASAAKRNPEIGMGVRAMMDSMGLEAMVAVQQALMHRPDQVRTLDTIRVPVCVIAGGEDQSSTPPEMHVVADRIAGAEFHMLTDAGHYAPFEQPRKAAEIIGEFLARHYGSAASQDEPPQPNRRNPLGGGPVH